jgi:hypothetical protein
MYIQETDFKGKWEIHQGMYSYEKINAYITRYTPIYMSQLLGPKLYEKYLVSPTDPCFEAITNPFVEEGNYDWHRGVFGEVLFSLQFMVKYANQVRYRKPPQA